MSSDNENNAYAKSTFPPDVASILALPTSGMRFPSKREVAEYIAVVDAVRGKDNKLSRKETLYDTAAYPNGYQKILCTKCKGRFTIHFTSAAKDKKVKTMCPVDIRDSAPCTCPILPPQRPNADEQQPITKVEWRDKNTWKGAALYFLIFELKVPVVEFRMKEPPCYGGQVSKETTCHLLMYCKQLDGLWFRVACKKLTKKDIWIITELPSLPGDAHGGIEGRELAAPRRPEAPVLEETIAPAEQTTPLQAAQRIGTITQPMVDEEPAVVATQSHASPNTRHMDDDDSAVAAIQSPSSPVNEREDDPVLKRKRPLDDAEEGTPEPSLSCCVCFDEGLATALQGLCHYREKFDPTQMLCTVCVEKCYLVRHIPLSPDSGEFCVVNKQTLSLCPWCRKKVLHWVVTNGKSIKGVLEAEMPYGWVFNRPCKDKESYLKCKHAFNKLVKVYAEKWRAVNVLLTQRQNFLRDSEVEAFPYITQAQKQKYLDWLRRGNDELQKCSNQLCEHFPDWTRGPNSDCNFDELPPIPVIDRKTPLRGKIELRNLLLYENYEWDDFKATEVRGSHQESIAIIETPLRSSRTRPGGFSEVATWFSEVATSGESNREEIEILDSSDEGDDSDYSPTRS